MAYDSARGRMVLFGGDDGYAYTNDTWEWDGTNWVMRAVVGTRPPAINAAAMAYDSRRGVMVFFGGATYEWNGSAWSFRSNIGPSPRSNPSMAYDSARGVTVLFGGVGGTPYGDNGETWEWDGSVWTQRVVPGPSPRDGQQMAFDAARNVTVLFGGEANNGTNFADTWEWDGNAWVQRASSGPPARALYGMAYDPGRGRTILFGGQSVNGLMADTWAWDGTSWTTLDDYPTPRSDHAWAYDSARQVSVLFGGLVLNNPYGNTVNAETWEWDGSSWAHPVVSGPSARYGHAMAYDSNRNATVLFGGAISRSIYQNQVFAPNNETWEWSGGVWKQREVTGPPPRRWHSMAYDPVRHVTVLFGGDSMGPLYSDTWEWDGTTWTQRSVTGPAARRGASMNYDAVRGVIVLTGGETRVGGTNVLTSETWEWDGTAWNQRADMPRWVMHHATAFDSVRGVTVLFGGVDTDSGYAGANTWEFDGVYQTWNSPLLSAPAAKTSHAMVFDAARGEVLAFGGLLHWSFDPPYQPTGDMWALGGSCPPPTISTQPQPRVICAGQTAALSIEAAGATSFNWQIQTAPGNWLTLGIPSVALPGGGWAYATPSNSPTVQVRINPSLGVNSYPIRCVVSNCLYVASEQAILSVRSADFNGDGDIGTDADIEAFFACLGGNCCAACGSADFDGDGVPATDADVEAFFRVIAGGAC
jgi:hypothetical protein